MAVVGEWWRNQSYGGRKTAFAVFLSIFLLHTFAILIFTSGFLLTRTELPYYSRCSDVSQSPCRNTTFQFQNDSQEQKCWTKPAIDRLVIVVLDALRFDFVAPSTFFEEKKPWMDKLQVLHKLASQPGSSAKIFKAIADPPTTSLQRSKGLTTGGLPTFIDIGNSFGAPAIVEDNLIHQLLHNGKRIVMMGDDTWLQLFPHHFNRSYPFPSFNVKDLDTVDNGCIEHLVPTLYSDDWDVLIAHFLGVDHAGHIFGVGSIQMNEKLEQYNNILEKVVEVLESQSGEGGLHENTLLLVMGDHGQTINGDHGGGSAEEVETSIFAMSLGKPSPSIPSEFDTSSCKLDLDGRKVCISLIQQLDFSVTVSALLGIPFPYGSIGRVNPILYALVAGTWNAQGYGMSDNESQSNVDSWMDNYANVLCINSWQVKKYIDVYTASSVIGFSNEDLMHVTNLYATAENLSRTLCKNESWSTSFDARKRQIDLYTDFLTSVAQLARTKWTEFNLSKMGIGFGIMLASVVVHLFYITRMDNLCALVFPSHECFRDFFGLIVSCMVVVIRAFSFLSNSYILEEGKVASFLLASAGIISLHQSLSSKKMVFEAVAFVLLICILRFAIELGLSKQSFHEVSMKIDLLYASGFWMHVADILPMLPLIILAYLLYMTTASSCCRGLLRYIILGSICSYILVAMHWASESDLSSLLPWLVAIRGNFIPRVIYITGLLQLLSLALLQLFQAENASDWGERTVIKTVAMLSAWSSTIIILSGKQGPLVALASIGGGWSIVRLKSLEQDSKIGKGGLLSSYSSSVTQWSLLATCLFFCTGHWCAFDGLRYAAAFIGFDEFTIIPQAILLTIDTFGFSHILPTLGLPLLVAYGYAYRGAKQKNQFFFMQLFQVYLIYGLILSVTTTFTIICVIIQRRHLMVWGLFAPKFVFDVVGLLLTDVMICVASLFYFIRL